ncbi:MAG: beta-eliminating lyase-related protein [Prevotella sp.]|nr:beta-eliminating lyase-related protein [Prevotella sp.]
MISFESDYNNGVLPEVLQRLVETNGEKTSGYGFDVYCESAKEKIRTACELPTADVFFLMGGTQTNATVIDSLLAGYQGVITADAGHINVHESGAVEAFGHKVLTLEGNNGKLSATAIDDYMKTFLADETHPHMVQPGMVYITFPTELGAIYCKDELVAIYDICRKYELLLYVDGARLGYGLMSEGCDVTLPFLARHCDVFYIGGTKIGLMFGEAVVFSNIAAPKHFFTIVKRHGALLAKGRMLGLQFDTLFTDELFFKVSRHAIEMAGMLKKVFVAHGIKLVYDSPSNQQFVILTQEEKEKLAKDVAFEVWQTLPDGRLLCRFVTCWSTTAEEIQQLDRLLG